MLSRFVHTDETSGFIQLKTQTKEHQNAVLNKDKTLSRVIDLDKTKSILPLGV